MFEQSELPWLWPTVHGTISHNKQVPGCANRHTLAALAFLAAAERCTLTWWPFPLTCLLTPGCHHGPNLAPLPQVQTSSPHCLMHRDASGVLQRLSISLPKGVDFSVSLVDGLVA